VTGPADPTLGPAGAGRGLVVAPNRAAAEAGSRALAAGGTAVDAAVAAAVAMAVVDQAGCGLAGYGGFLVYAPPARAPVAVEFNTWVPARVEARLDRVPGDTSDPLEGGASVSPPAVVAGLLAAHARFGRRPIADLVAPAIELARNGFPIGRDLARAFSDHWHRTGGGAPSFARAFYPAGRVPGRGETLVQPELASTLEALASDGPDAFRGGPIVEAICTTVGADGGFLEPADFHTDRTTIEAAESGGFEAGVVYGPSRQTSGTGVVLPALASLAPERLGPNRGRSYVDEVRRVLASAWQERARAALTARHTTHLCAADGEGGLAALTFTHGPRRFGSGLVAPGTGLVLNSGMNLVAPTSNGPLAVTNMAPVVIEDARGRRHAVGSVGGPRIPGVILTTVVDIVHYGLSIDAAIAAPRLSVSPLDGVLEAEAELIERLGLEQQATVMRAAVEFGPTCGIGGSEAGWTPGADARFETAAAWA
jgi:gamma-glutamyltranspeptidase / glutathione hydrolase